jgi:predicted phage terminase large subunit-like protein
LVAWRLTAVRGPPFSSPDRGRRAVVEQNALFRPQTIVIEDRASGTQLIQDLIGDGLSHVARFSPDGDKIMRLHAQSAVIENGFVFVPEEAPWLADYLAELTTFPAGRHDDQVDSTAQFLAWTKIRPPGSGFLDYYRQEAERLRAPPPGPMVRFLAPGARATSRSRRPAIPTLCETARSKSRKRTRRPRCARGSEGIEGFARRAPAPDDAAWLAGARAERAAFPTGRHDEQPP